ncbi:MAG: DUF362 domain-containing protein, partial [Chrysiogenales bacterium]
SVIHASVLRPLIEHFGKMSQGNALIVIADNPVEGADFNAILKKTGIGSMVTDLRNKKNIDLSVCDLRPLVLKEDQKGHFYQEKQTGDPLGYVEVDLGKDSMFSELDGVEGIHYYTLADSTIDHIDPHKVQESRTDQYHRSGMHKYLVSKTILDADLIINVAKMKTHCKAGVSMALKNMIGMVYLKECMPHHRPGPPPLGDSFPDYPAAHYVASRKAYRFLRTSFGIQRIPGFRTLRNLMQKKKILIGQHIEHGNWKGNDTIWRTILDLNRIAIYADRNGVMRDTPQRQMLCIIDGIIAQQGEGPMSGEPVNAGIVFGGDNPVLVDALGVKAMGIDWDTIPHIARAVGIKKWPLLPEETFNLDFTDMDVPNLHFAMPKGWQ